MGRWLSQQHDQKDKDDNAPLKLVETRKINHVQTREHNTHYCGNRFSISKSGAVGISCSEKPSLSVMFPNTDKPPTVLSNTKVYRSATFLKICDVAYLAAACDEDACLYLWDTKDKTSRKMFDPKLPTEQALKKMNIFKVNDGTIGYGEVLSLSDGSRRVFILHTNTEEFTLCSTLRLFTRNTIFDTSYTETEGTPYLLLCIPRDNRIMAVEIVGGKTRWEVGKEEMGEKFYPYTICTDQNGCAYVADNGQDKIHLLSVSDGTVIKRFDVGSNYGIRNVIAIRFHDHHLYVEHKIPNSKYAISKFKENEGLQ